MKTERFLCFIYCCVQKPRTEINTINICCGCNDFLNVFVQGIYHLCFIVRKMNHQKEGTSYADCNAVIIYKNNKVNQVNLEF